ncbi:MAG: hypothetical protein O3A00_16400 [Planctomycetota bacterium]|nr:hypothetical protein [Planctomycetota bacterium]
MRLKNGPWLSLFLLTPLFGVIALAVFDLPTHENVRASSPTDQATVAPKKAHAQDGRWWIQPKGDVSHTRREAVHPSAPSRVAFDSETGRHQSSTGAEDLFAEFGKQHRKGDAFDAFERETAAWNDEFRSANHVVPQQLAQPEPVSVPRHVESFGHAPRYREIVTPRSGFAEVDPISLPDRSNSSQRPTGSNPTRSMLANVQPLEQQPLTWRTAIARLNHLGISEYRLEPGLREHEFLFSCRFTPSDNPRLTRLFMAEAVEPLRAVGKVIEQVEQWKRLR